MTPELKSLLAKYQAIAPKQGLDPLGYAFPPFGYAAGQALAAGGHRDQQPRPGQDRAISCTATRSTRCSATSPSARRRVDEVARTYFVQFQRRNGDGSLDQFRDLSHEAIVWPDDMKTGDLIYPYSAAKKP